MHKWPLYPGEIRGHNYVWGGTKAIRDIAVLKGEANRLKTRLCISWRTHLGKPGSWSFYRAPGDAHDLITSHFDSERDQVLKDPYADGGERTVRQWNEIPGVVCYNELWDGSVMASAGLAALGCVQPDFTDFYEEIIPKKKEKKKRVVRFMKR